MGLAWSIARVLIRNDPSCADRDAATVPVARSSSLAVVWPGSFAPGVALRLPREGIATLVDALIEVSVLVALACPSLGARGRYPATGRPPPYAFLLAASVPAGRAAT